MRRPAAVLVSLLLIAACTSGDDGEAPLQSSTSTTVAPLRLGSRGGCGDVALFAGGDLNLLVAHVDPDQRAADGSLQKTFTLPAEGIHVELRRGQGLGLPCYDVLPDDYRVDSVTPAVSGTIVVTLDPSAPDPGPYGSDCGSYGQAEIRDLLLEDGTAVETSIISSNDIGCVGG